MNNIFVVVEVVSRVVVAEHEEKAIIEAQRLNKLGGGDSTKQYFAKQLSVRVGG